jgi:hypothetical protein
MLKFRLVPSAVVLMSLAAAVGASAAPLPFCAQEDPMKEVFLASSRAPLPTKCGNYCDTAGGGTTPTGTAIGSSCSVVSTNLTAQLKSYANSFCGNLACKVVVTTTIACHASGSGYSASGYATFGCPDSTC